MSYASLVKLEEKTLEFPHFPTRLQLIVWRSNWFEQSLFLHLTGFGGKGYLLRVYSS